MIKYQIETEEYCLYCPDTLKDIFLKILPSFKKKLKEYFLLFNIKNLEKLELIVLMIFKNFGILFMI